MAIFPNSNKILGLNARNLLFIRGVNPRRAIKLARNKLETKKCLEKAGLPVPKTYAIIHNRRELLDFYWNMLPTDFALKPNFGSGGEGIIVVFGKKKNGDWITTNSEQLTQIDIINHVSDILDGNFSLGNAPDIAFFEERLKISSDFRPYSFKGIPDIRVIVYNRIPIMAMMRLPTKASHGKANLHAGAIGVGIDLARGITTQGLIGNIPTIYHPENKLLLTGIKIPYWKEILKLSIEAQDAVGLGYMGADITIDPRYGPIIIEVNGHPGLNIQLANLATLKDRLKRVEGLGKVSIEKGLRLAASLFGGEYEQELGEKAGRAIVGPVEDLGILKKDNNWMNLKAKIDTGADLTSIDSNLLKELGYKDYLEKMNALKLPITLPLKEDDNEIKKQYPNPEEIVIIQSSHGKTVRLQVPLTVKLSQQVLKVEANIVSREHLKYPIIVGKKDLKNFLVDPSKQ